jgi:hypothetical protein
MNIFERFASKERYGKPLDKQKELDKFYKEVDKYPLNKIISYDAKHSKHLLNQQ